LLTPCRIDLESTRTWPPASSRQTLCAARLSRVPRKWWAFASGCSHASAHRCEMIRFAADEDFHGAITPPELRAPGARKMSAAAARSFWRCEDSTHGQTPGEVAARDSTRPASAGPARAGPYHQPVREVRRGARRSLPLFPNGQSEPLRPTLDAGGLT
jgi:hypothetical protein